MGEKRRSNGGDECRFEGTGRKTASLVGALYILGTLAGVMSVAFTSSFLSAPDYLKQIPANANQIILGALSVLVMGFALALVPVVPVPDL